MFGHLKAEDFTNLIEGIAIPPRRQAHLEKCVRCAKEWKAVESIHMSIAASEGPENDNIVEPDWAEFRSSVREEMLSRSALRSVETRRWTAWKLAPAGVSLAAALSLGVLLSRFLGSPAIEPPEPEQAVDELALENDSIETEAAVWVSASAFDEVISLGPEESERFRELLENETLRVTQSEGPAESTP